MKNKVAIIGGGTYNPVFNHFGLASKPARGTTAKQLYSNFLTYNADHDGRGLEPHLYLSKTCSMHFNYETPRCVHLDSFLSNDELQDLIDDLKEDSEMKMIILTAAVCDFLPCNGSDDIPRPSEIDVPVSEDFSIPVYKADKIVRSIRDKNHKHIFLVAFKQTCNSTPEEMYLAGLNLCKKASANLVFVNDVKTRHNMIVTPEEAAYADGWERKRALKELVEIATLRSHLSFTRSTVISGEAVGWESELVPEALRTVVNYCIEKNAYKPFNGSTVGHFACKLNDTTFLTSIRRSNFNDLHKIGLVKVVTDGPDDVYAYGFKPSVGGQSQRIIFSENSDVDCIVHFHSPLKENHADDIQIMSQREVECGSHECGRQTANGLRQFGNLKAVYLDQHGPNIVFNRDINPQEVIDFIDRNFDLSEKTGGYNLTSREVEV